MKLSHMLPFVIFMTLVIAFIALLLHPRGPERLSRAMPAINMEGLNKLDLNEGVVMVNFFASWCAPCRLEHPLLLDFSDIPIYGIAYKDKKEDTDAYLKELGNPYKKIGNDYEGRAFIDWGLAGVPESFILKDGVILYRFSGELRATDLQDIRSLIAELKAP